MWGHSLVNMHMVAFAISQSSVGALLPVVGRWQPGPELASWSLSLGGFGYCRWRGQSAQSDGKPNARAELPFGVAEGFFLISKGNHSIFRLENGKY